jgi:predicted secreted hydrolase
MKRLGHLATLQLAKPIAIGRLRRRRQLLQALMASGWTTWVHAAGGASALQSAAGIPPLAHAKAAEDTRVRPRALTFPMDHGAHPATRIEWWYATGRLRLADASDLANASAQAPLRRPEGSPTPDAYGFQVTFFRSRTSVPSDHPSRFAASQLLFAHAALTDLRAGRLHHDQRIARAGFGIANARVGDTEVTLRDWRFARTGAPTATGNSPGASRYTATMSSDSADFALSLQMDTTQPLLLQGDSGYSQKGPQTAQASHYYSQPQLAVSGTLTRAGRTQAVRGTAWLDHEWSDSLLDPAAVGWDWIGMNLDDGSALTAFRLRDAAGGAVFAGGGFRTPGAAVRDFGAAEVRWTPGRRWTSPSTKASYPVDWTVDTPAGRFQVRALLDGQELDSRASTGTVYWEGLSELLDASGQRVGGGYLEMTGYAAPMSL